MAKFTADEKIQIVLRYLNGNESYREIGKAIAKLNPDFREGRSKKYNKKQINHELTLLTIHSYKQVAEMTGISESTLLWAKRARDKCNKEGRICEIQ